MMISRLFFLVGVACLAAFACQSALCDDAPDDATIAVILEFIGDRDKDTRALGLQQVREEAKGAAATERFAAALPKLPADIQMELLGALADRGDKAARSAVLDRLDNGETPVKLAALRALGPLGEASDVPLLTQRLATGSPDEQAAARESLVQMCGQAINPAIASGLNQADSKLRIALIDVLTARRAADSTAAILPYITADDAEERKTAISAMGSLAGAEGIANMLPGILKAKPGAERDAAEKAVMLACNRIEAPEARSATLLAAWEKYGPSDKTVLLGVLGRVGGAATLKIVEVAMADEDQARREAGIEALCRWPDATVADRLLAVIQNAATPQQRRLALQALMRVAVLPDARSSSEKLVLLEKALSLATTDEERNYAIKRARAIRTIETLRFVVPYLDKPEFAQESCATVVELAHHRALREPNKAEFDKALDVVIAICKDADLVDRAQRYKKGLTRMLPPPDASK